MSGCGLEGRTVLVTGGSRGIGRAIVETFVRAGCRVALTASTERTAVEAARDLSVPDHPVAGFGFDLADADATATALDRIRDACGKISVLVNNAALTRDGLLLRMKQDDWDRVLETNLTSIYRLCRALIPSMLRARHGRIVNISSVVARTGNPGQVNYAAAKAGLEGFTRSLAREVASRNVTVNCVAPGFIDTEMTRSLKDDVRSRLLEQVPMGRLGTPADVAAAVRFLASDDAGYVTGVTLNVNGGMAM